MSFELWMLSVIYYVHILFEPAYLHSVNSHVFKLYSWFAENMVFVKCYAVYTHSTQINRLTDKQIPMLLIAL